MTDTQRVLLDTDLGGITIDLAQQRAPATCAYFVGLVQAGHYDHAYFYRSTQLGDPGRRPLIQGGPLEPLFTGSARAVPEVQLLEAVESTTATGLRHELGVVSLARDLLATGYVLPELFVCLADYPELDAGGRTEPDTLGFPAFGRVTRGHDVVEAIAQGTTDGRSPVGRFTGEILGDPVQIHRSTVC